MARFDRFTKALAVGSFSRAIKILIEQPSFSCSGTVCHVHGTCPRGCFCLLMVGGPPFCEQV